MSGTFGTPTVVSAPRTQPLTEAEKRACRTVEDLLRSLPGKPGRIVTVEVHPDAVVRGKVEISRSDWDTYEARPTLEEAIDQALKNGGAV